MDNITQFLSEDIILGNAPLDWFRASVTFGVILFLLLILKYIGKAKLISTEQPLRIQLVVYSFLGKINFLVAIILAVYPALYNLTLPLKMAKISRKLFVIFVFAQFIIWAMHGISLYSKHYVQRKLDKDPASLTAPSVFTLLAKIFVFILIFMLMLDQLGFNITTLVAGLGIGGIAVALALQNILGDVFASLTIALDKPFRVGDNLLLDNIWGTIEHVGLKNTRLRTYEGSLLIVPNNYLLQNKIQNYSEADQRRTLVKFSFIYETPTEKLKKIPEILKVAIESVEHTRFDTACFADYGSSSLIFEVIYYCSSPLLLQNTRHKVNIAILEALNRNEIKFAYPTQTLNLINNE